MFQRHFRRESKTLTEGGLRFKCPRLAGLLPVRRLSSRCRHGDVGLSGSRVSTRSLSNCERLAEEEEGGKKRRKIRPNSSWISQCVNLSVCVCYIHSTDSLIIQ